MYKLNLHDNCIYLLLYKIKYKFQLIHNKHLFNACFSEFIGTFILITIGLSSMLHNTLKHNLYYINLSIGWSIAYLLSQIITQPLGYNSLMNPSITLSLAFINKLSFYYVIPLTIIQFISSLLSSLMLYYIYYYNYISIYDNIKLIILNQFITTPNVSHLICFIDRLLLTIITTIFILIIRDDRNDKIQKNYRLIYIIIFTSGRITSLSMNAGTSINPIRDLGPRITIALCELGLDAFKKDHYYFWIPIVAPYIGSIIGAIFYELLIGAYLNKNIVDKLQNTIEISQSQIFSSSSSSSSSPSSPSSSSPSPSSSLSLSSSMNSNDSTLTSSNDTKKRFYN
ncbi:unnamed protein product [Schistosoma spindalis]|nr:unnamed protein product [Schistosoma spindale]